jgi:hypothetical protein
VAEAYHFQWPTCRLFYFNTYIASPPHTRRHHSFCPELHTWPPSSNPLCRSTVDALADHGLLRLSMPKPCPAMPSLVTLVRSTAVSRAAVHMHTISTPHTLLPYSLRIACFGTATIFGNVLVSSSSQSWLFRSLLASYYAARQPLCVLSKLRNTQFLNPPIPFHIVLGL